jgi:hypothetical protein
MPRTSIPSSTDKECVFQTVRPSDDAVVRAVQAAGQTDGSTTPWPWCFYLIGPETAEGIAWMEARRVEREQGEYAARDVFNTWSQIPGWVVITCKETENPAEFEENYALCRNALQNFVLSLGSEHIDTSWIGEGIIEEGQLYSLLTIDPAVERIIGILWYGYRESSTSRPDGDREQPAGSFPIRYRP